MSLDGVVVICVSDFVFRFFLRYELAEECCDDDDAKVDFNDLKKSVLEELKMHDSFVQVLSLLSLLFGFVMIYLVMYSIISVIKSMLVTLESNTQFFDVLN